MPFPHPLNSPTQVCSFDLPRMTYWQRSQVQMLNQLVPHPSVLTNMNGCVLPSFCPTLVDTDGFTTDGRQTDTDTRHTDGETDIERAIDLTDVDDSVLSRSSASRFHGMTHVANLDLVLGASKDPSVSANFSDDDGTSDEDDDGNASQGGSSIGSRASSVRSVLSMFKRRGRPNPGMDAPQSSAAPSSTNQHGHDGNALAGVINLVSADFDSDVNNEDSKKGGELCYSTSLGSAVGPPEPLSFVDGGR